MAKKTETYEITLTMDEWRKYKMLTNKSSGKCYKDPSEVFLLGLKTAFNVHR